MRCSPPEGKAKRNYQACDEKGDLTPEKILEKMDMIYGTSVSFWDLNAKLCSLKQGEWESPKDYYEQMVDISVALKEYMVTGSSQVNSPG